MPVICVRAGSSDFQVEKNSLHWIKCSNLSICINNDINEDIPFSWKYLIGTYVLIYFDDVELRSLTYSIKSKPLFPMTFPHLQPTHQHHHYFLWFLPSPKGALCILVPLCWSRSPIKTSSTRTGTVSLLFPPRQMPRLPLKELNEYLLNEQMDPWNIFPINLE